MKSKKLLYTLLFFLFLFSCPISVGVSLPYQSIILQQTAIIRESTNRLQILNNRLQIDLRQSITDLQTLTALYQQSLENSQKLEADLSASLETSRTASTIIEQLSTSFNSSVQELTGLKNEFAALKLEQTKSIQLLETLRQQIVSLKKQLQTQKALTWGISISAGIGGLILGWLIVR